jgi:hypothetical protein
MDLDRERVNEYKNIIRKLENDLKDAKDTIHYYESTRDQAEGRFLNSILVI